MFRVAVAAPLVRLRALVAKIYVMRFQDKVVLITGSASGIGLAAAQAFAAEGAKLVLADRKAETGEAVAERLRQAGHAVIFVPTDVSDYAAVQRLVAAAVSQFGRLDIAINNAGIGAPLAPTAEVALPDWDRVIAVNQTGVFYGLK